MLGGEGKAYAGGKRTNRSGKECASEEEVVHNRGREREIQNKRISTKKILTRYSSSCQSDEYCLQIKPYPMLRRLELLI